MNDINIVKDKGITKRKDNPESASKDNLNTKMNFANDKVFPVDTLQEIIDEKKKAGKKVVFTNGCFDILHVGHARYLAAARAKGDLLVLGLNSDGSVRKLKGAKRPLVPEEERAELLSYLEMIDYIVIFEETTAKNLISRLEPDIYVKGGDYKVDELPEAAVVQKYGGKIELIPVVEGASTTNIVEKILERYN
ncbi:MAG: D-glycero-beta-D-manno-heptose 1-phosphate adenylyltransferase [Halanaerobiales bacterium]